MYKIGITGSIGTGKSTIAKMFALFNIPIFDADKEIKKILDYHDVKETLKNIWPQIKNKNKNEINKLKLKSIIFSNEIEKKKLEQILYPYLKIERKLFEEKNITKKILVYDVPLIYETKSNKLYDLILLANCDPKLQKARVLKRDKISSILFEKIVNSQLSFEEKIKFKPLIINTRSSKLYILLKIILILFRINLTLKNQDGKRKKINT